jgi:hypothetical protein
MPDRRRPSPAVALDDAPPQPAAAGARPRPGACAPWLRGGTAAALIALVGCSGTIEGEREPDGKAEPGAANGGKAGGTGGSGAVGQGDRPPGAPGAGGTAGGTASCTQPSAGPAPLRRLNRLEYNRTVRDLLGDATNPADALPPEEKGNGFGNDANALGVSRLLAEQYFTVAKGIAARATADAAAFAKLVGCDPTKTGGAAGEETCAKGFIDAFGLRAYRRPLDATEKADLLKVYADVRATGADFKTGVQAILATTLQAPQFLYRIELGAGKPDPYEMATRLSYLLWGSMPDNDLFAAAKAGKLGSKDEVLAQAKRMLADARGRDTVRQFHALLFGLLGLDGLQRNTTSFPKYTPELGPLFREEIERFLDHVVWDGSGDVAGMLTASYSFVNGPLAKFYGRTDVTGAAFQKVDFDPTKRAGFMTSAGIMASTTPGTATNPVMRGVYVRSKLLCNPPPDPPPALMVEEPEPDPKSTTRERFIKHQTDPSCVGCHTLMDPIGFGFENYDGVGLWRTTDNGRPVDVTGEIVGTDVAGKFTGPVELMKKLSQSAQLRQCLVSNWFTFAYGRAETEADRCSRAQLEAAFMKSGFKIRELVLALTQTDAFLLRP